MTSEREKNSKNNGLGTLTMLQYDIDGNLVRAFYDTADNLVFVIDDTVLPDKPNALLVINSDGDRKWDDILANDYGVSLEVVRPKKDNKYQKLDIEYSGLDEYDDLIQDFDAELDLTAALDGVRKFRQTAARRAATERAAAAEKIAENARKTIEKTRGALAALQVRIKELRTKLNAQKKSVGKEPTKQSAAKILRTESQIDAIKDKQQRAQRRLDNARRRLVAAEEDIAAARAILARDTVAVADTAPSLPARAPNHAVATRAEGALVNTAAENDAAPASNTEAAAETVPSFNTIVFDEYADDDEPVELNTINQSPQITAPEQSEQKAKEMAEEEVKPLFDKDPEILDEEIAFKPIDFNVAQSGDAPMASAAPRAMMPGDVSDVAAPAPLSFVPPSGGTHAMPDEPARTAPVLDAITSVEPYTAPGGQMPASGTAEFAQPSAGYAPAPTDAGNIARPAPVNPTVPGSAAAAAIPPRPVSPVTGAPASPVKSGGNNGGRKPTVLYYVLLIALIALSIFTLWLYQQKNNDTVPDLAETSKPEATSPDTNAQPEGVESPFVQVEEVAVTQPAPVIDETPAPQVAEEPAPSAPVVDETVPAVPVTVEPEPAPAPMPDDTPFVTEPEPEPEPVQPIINKPVYNAGAQNENMFVADENYDTEVVTTTAAQPYQETVTETTYEAASSAPVCDDGTPADANGCCTGEVYTDTGNGYACCSQATGDCFQPL